MKRSGMAISGCSLPKIVIGQASPVESGASRRIAQSERESLIGATGCANSGMGLMAKSSSARRKFYSIRFDIVGRKLRSGKVAGDFYIVVVPSQQPVGSNIESLQWTVTKSYFPRA